MQTIEVKQLAVRLASREANLIDVRMPTGYYEIHQDEIHQECAANTPLGSLHPRAVMKSRIGMATQSLYAICRSGNRLAQFCRKFMDAGFENVVNVDGGIIAWDKAGLMFAGATGLRPMTSAITSMPWNQGCNENGGGSCSV